MKPLDLAFNAAVMTMANKTCPTGYDVSTGDMMPAPTNLYELNEYIADNKRILVNGANSERTIFGDPEHNWAFRAWHDWTHWILQAEFTLDGELAVAHRQCQDIARIFGHSERTDRWHRIIMAEVYGQALYKHLTGEFPRDQIAFDRTYKHNGMTQALTIG